MAERVACWSIQRKSTSKSADAAIPVALVSIGAALTRYQLKEQLSECLMVSVVSLIVHPVLVLMLCHYLLALPAPFVQAAVLIAAMPEPNSAAVAVPSSAAISRAARATVGLS